ncbi:MAG: replication-relaxation family protein [bacterium]|nr:replication-relaxation family protein [bacterium]
MRAFWFNSFYNESIAKNTMPRKSPLTKERLPRNRRAKNPPNFRVTDRDIAVLRFVLDYRFLHLQQLLWLLPDSSSQKLATRLRLMYHHGYLERTKQVPGKESSKLVYALTEKGASLLAATSGVPREEIAWSRHNNVVTPSHLQHLLAINDLMISMHMALGTAKQAGTVKSFRVVRGEPQQYRLKVMFRDKDGKRYFESAIPDAIVGVEFTQGGYQLFIVEIDRGTMTSNRWRQKIAIYREYMRSPDLLERFQAHGFILLTITTTGRRLDTLAQATASVGGRRGFWFTTAGEMNPNSAMGQIWVRASDLYELRKEQTTRLAEPAQRASLADSL